MKHLFKALLLLLALFLPAIATAHDFEVDGIYYNINGNEVSVTYFGSSYWQYSNEYSGDVTIPSTVSYNGTSYSVTSISNSAFYYCTALTSVTIPNSVTSIGNSAFDYCSGLTSVNIPNSVTTIGSNAFSSCSGLTSITIPNAVTTIGYSAFFGCSGLTSVNIGNSVTSIGSSAFYGCTGLTSITVESGNSTFDSRDNCNAIIETASNTLVFGCKNTTIPNSITSIGSGAFSGCNGLASITIPNSVTSIGSSAFSGCSGLTSINIPNSVTTIGDFAFHNCSNLKSFEFPESFTSIGLGAFHDTKWYDNQPDGVVYAGLFAYYYKGVIPNGTSIVLKEGTLGIAIAAFGNHEVEKSKLNTLIRFDHACGGLKSIIIPNSVIYINDGAFNGCTNLTSVYMGNSVTSIDNGAFNYCPNLTNVYCFGSVPPVCGGNWTFSNYSATLHVPASSLAAYFTAPCWSNFENIVGDAVAPSGITISQDSVEIQLGEQLQLNASVTPANASYKEVSWRSSDDAIATVDNGMVTAVGNGECDIIASSFGIETVCHVSVFNRISIDQQEILLLPNHMMTLTPTAPVMPEGFAVTSSDPTVAAARVMNGKVQVVGITEGTTTITVEATDGTATPANCLVTVYTEVGDLNRDGFTNMDDLTVMINYMLTGNDEGISLTNADVNGNGVSMDDLTVLINYLLTGQWP